MKKRLLEAFEQELKAYPWAQDQERLARFMDAARQTLNGANLIDRTGPAWLKALDAVGLPRKIPLHLLHDLPD